MVQTIQIKKGVQIELEDLISSLSELDEQALRAFFEKLNHRIAHPELPNN
jgi:nucleoid-associated protein YejK